MAQWSFGQRQPSREAESTGRTLELLNQLSTNYGRMKVAVAQEEKKAAEMGARRRLLDAFKASSFREMPVVEKDATGKERNVKKIMPVSNQEFLTNYFDTRAKMSQLGASEGELQGLDVAAKEWYQKETPVRESADVIMLHALQQKYGEQEGAAQFQQWLLNRKAAAPYRASTDQTETAGGVIETQTVTGGAEGAKPTISHQKIGELTPREATPGGKSGGGKEKVTIQIYKPNDQGGFNIVEKAVDAEEASVQLKTGMSSALKAASGDLQGIGISPEGLNKLGLTQADVSRWGGVKGKSEDDDNMYFSLNQDRLTSSDPAVVADELKKVQVLTNAAVEADAGNAEFKDVLVGQIKAWAKAKAGVNAAVHMHEQAKQYFGQPVPAKPAAQPAATPAPAAPAAAPAAQQGPEYVFAIPREQITSKNILQAIAVAEDPKTPPEKAQQIIDALVKKGYLKIKGK